MNQSIYHTTTFKVLFWGGMLVLFILAFTIDISAAQKKYKQHAKQERIFAKRKASNQSEQYRIQSPGVKTYNKRNAWQRNR